MSDILPFKKEEIESNELKVIDWKIKATQEQKNGLEIIILDQKTLLHVIAIHKERSNNKIFNLSCKKGMPIGGHTYNTTNDCYILFCSDYITLGYLPFSVKLKIRGIPDCDLHVPLAENVIKKFLSSQQKIDFKNFKNYYKSEEFDIQFVQMIDPNT